MKQCCNCKELKPIDAFWLHRKTGTKRQNFCKECGTKRMRVYRKTPVSQAANRLRWKNRGLPQKLAIFRRADTKTKDPQLTPANVLAKFGQAPRCYLTGNPIDLNQWDSYSLDHIFPVAKGGKSTLDNCGLTCRRANLAKRDIPHHEFIALCQQVVDHSRSVSLLG